MYREEYESRKRFWEGLKEMSEYNRLCEELSDKKPQSDKVVFYLMDGPGKERQFFVKLNYPWQN